MYRTISLNAILRGSFVLAFALAFGARGVATAGLPHWHRHARRQVPYPTNTYAPQMRHYTVIDPTAASRPQTKKHSFMKDPSPPGQVLWRQNVEPVPTYPWGWFGARSHVQNIGHYRYYGDARDWGYFRGD